MNTDARKEILNRLKSSPAKSAPVRPDIGRLPEMDLSGEELIAKFIAGFQEQTGIAYRVKGWDEVFDKLSEILKEEKVHKAICTSDDVMRNLSNDGWAAIRNCEITFSNHFNDKQEFKEAAFSSDAGITGVDYAVAETGTAVILHGENQPRLASLAPAVHIAIVPVSRIVPVYESVMQNIFGDNRPQGELTFITGPSMTADIQMTPFRGMHGPRKMYAVIIDSM